MLPITAAFFMGYIMLNIGLEAAAWTTVGSYCLFRYGPAWLERHGF
jgi:hypothetical protein